MIGRMSDMPPGTLGFRLTGEVEREDYDEVLVPELRAVLEAGGGLRTLYLIEDLDEIEGGALWADTKLGFDLGVRRTATGSGPPSSPTRPGWSGR